MQNLLLIVNNDNVWLEVGDTEVGRNGPTTRSFATWQITEDFVFCVHTVHNEVDEVVVSPIAKIKKVKKYLEKQCLCGHGHKLTSRKYVETTNHQSFVWPTMV